MADKENCGRVTRLAKRRAEEAMAAASQQRPSKKRVVLGELKNLSANVSDPKKEQRCSKPKRKVVKEVLGVKEKMVEDPAIDIDAKSDDPQMCKDYVSDIYAYLRKMEVGGPRNTI